MLTLQKFAEKYAVPYETVRALHEDQFLTVDLRKDVLYVCKVREGSMPRFRALIAQYQQLFAKQRDIETKMEVLFSPFQRRMFEMIRSVPVMYQEELLDKITQWKTALDKRFYRLSKKTMEEPINDDTT